MKAALIVAGLVVAFAIVGTIDYQVAAGMAADRSATPHPPHAQKEARSGTS